MAYSVEDYFAQEMHRMSGGSKGSYWGTSFSGGLGTIAGGPTGGPSRGAPDGGTPKTPPKDHTPPHDSPRDSSRSETPMPNYWAQEGGVQFSYEGWNPDGSYCNGTASVWSQSAMGGGVSVSDLPRCGPKATYGKKPKKLPKSQDTGVNKAFSDVGNDAWKDTVYKLKANWDWF